MKKSTYTFAAQLATFPHRLRDELFAHRDRGSISVETVVIALGLFALGSAVVAFLIAWANGKLGDLG